MRIFRWLCTTLLIQLATAVGAQAADTINNPDPATIYLLQCRWSDTTPDFDAMAQADSSVKAADEFHKSDVAKRLAANLKARFASLNDVKEVSVTFPSRFSEYDSQNGEYDLDISDGTYIPAHAFGRDFRMELSNGTLAQGWKLSPKDAEVALRKNKGDRAVRLALRLALQRSPPAAEGEPLILKTKVIGYDVLTPLSGVRLGSTTIEGSN